MAKKTKSSARMEAQLEQIRKSLARAAVREQQLGEDLDLAEQEGRERDAVRLRRELADLGRSTDELQATLDLIEARIELVREDEGLPEPGHTEDFAALSEEAASSEAAPTRDKEDDDLASRKTRLSAPQKKS
jgi:hypothetical protein